jgi:hypothetical protein
MQRMENFWTELLIVFAKYRTSQAEAQADLTSPLDVATPSFGGTALPAPLPAHRRAVARGVRQSRARHHTSRRASRQASRAATLAWLSWSTTAPRARRLIPSGYLLYGKQGTRVRTRAQSLRAYAHTSSFAAPGTADLTADVNFALLGEALASAPARLLSLLSQRAFITRMPLVARVQALTRGKAPERSRRVCRASWIRGGWLSSIRSWT